MRLRCVVPAVLFAIALVAAGRPIAAQETGKTIRVGIIGLDTSHAAAFTGLLNNPKAVDAYVEQLRRNQASAALIEQVRRDLAGVHVVAAYPGGSPDLPSSWDRVKGYTEQFRTMNIEIVDSIDELLKKVDAVLLESVDGRPHLAQARPVIAAGKPLFIDKPMAASLADGITIFRLAKEHNVPCFSSSSLRYGAGVQEIRNKTSPLGEVKSCLAWGPLHVEAHHPDLFWYGIHGVETLFTIMGPGCKAVTRVAPDKVVGVWADGRKGTFEGRKDYGAEVEGTNGNGKIGKYQGYAPLVVEICKFFKTGKPPVAAEETLEILAFMEAADESKRQDGAPVTIESVMAKAQAKAAATAK